MVLHKIKNIFPTFKVHLFIYFDQTKNYISE